MDDGDFAVIQPCKRGWECLCTKLMFMNFVLHLVHVGHQCATTLCAYLMAMPTAETSMCPPGDYLLGRWAWQDPICEEIKLGSKEIQLEKRGRLNV